MIVYIENFYGFYKKSNRTNSELSKVARDKINIPPKNDISIYYNKQSQLNYKCYLEQHKTYEILKDKSDKRTPNLYIENWNIAERN